MVDGSSPSRLIRREVSNVRGFLPFWEDRGGSPQRHYLAESQRIVHPAACSPCEVPWSRLILTGRGWRFEANEHPGFHRLPSGGDLQLADCRPGSSLLVSGAYRRPYLPHQTGPVCSHRTVPRSVSPTSSGSAPRLYRARPECRGWLDRSLHPDPVADSSLTRGRWITRPA
jgi:hypothetical protein